MHYQATIQFNKSQKLLVYNISRLLQKKLDIKILFYNICLFIIKNKKVNFSIIKFQINNTFNIQNSTFVIYTLY